uniref:Uncharacterized protein n=1 Tax=Cacopsylla melanoneura TaxID=428564 RepID=A0A8D8WQ66_9HEMI
MSLLRMEPVCTVYLPHKEAGTLRSRDAVRPLTRQPPAPLTRAAPVITTRKTSGAGPQALNIVRTTTTRVAGVAFCFSSLPLRCTTYRRDWRWAWHSEPLDPRPRRPFIMPRVSPSGLAFKISPKASPYRCP